MVVGWILKMFPRLTKNDVRSNPMGSSGVDVLLSQLAIDLFPYSIECKNYARIAVYSWWDQCVHNVVEGTQPCLVIKQNHSQPLAVITLEHFMELTKSKSSA